MMLSKKAVDTDYTNRSNSYPASRQANYVLGLLFLAYTLSFLDRQILGILIGPIKDDLQISDFQFSLLQGAAFAILYSVMGLPFGRMADSKNRKIIMAAGVFGWSLMTIGCGMAKNFTQLFLVRMGVGVGEAALSPAAYSTITDCFPREKLTGALAIYKGGIIIGSGLAFVLGGILYDYYASVDSLEFPLFGQMAAWQATFVTVGLPGFVLSVLILLTKEPRRKGLLRTSHDSPATSLRIKEVFSYIFSEQRTLYVCLFGGSSLLAIVFYGYTSWFTEMLIRSYDLSRSQAGSLYGSVYIAAGFLGLFLGPLMVGSFQRRGLKDSNMRALMVIAVAVLPAAIVAPQMPTHQWALALVAPVVFLQAAYSGVSAAAVQMVTPNQMRGQATAIFIFLTNMLGLALGSSLIAGITDFVFADESMLNYSLTAVSVILIPLAGVLFWKGLKAFAAAIEQSENWA